MVTPALQGPDPGTTHVRGRKLHGWRKLAGSFWGPPNDPQFYGDLELDAGHLLEYLQQVREQTGTHVTITHAIGRAVAHGLEGVPGLRLRLAHGREYPRETTDVFFIVAADGGELTGLQDRTRRREVPRRDRRGARVSQRSIASGSDATFGKAKRMLQLLPPECCARR